MLNVGLTGGIACGKSTVAEMLVENGAILIDFDVLVRRLQEPGQPVWQAIVDAFGASVLKRDRTIDRPRLAELVFTDAGNRVRLNNIVHPAVFDAWHRQLDAIGQENDRAIVVSDIPLLIEVGRQKEVDVLVLVYVPPAEQVERLIRRDGCTRSEALDRLASQMPIDEKIRYAHVVIDNRGTREQTGLSVDALWKDLLRRGQHKRQDGR